METFFVDGLTVHRRGTGGLKFLLVHGMWAGEWIFENWIEFLASRGYQVFSYDLRAHHSNLREDIGKISAAQHIADLWAIIRYIHHFYGPINVLLGHSAGGLFAQKIASITEWSCYKPKKYVFVTSAPPRWIRLRGDVWRKSIKYLDAIIFSKAFGFSPQDASEMLFNGIPTKDHRRLSLKLCQDSGQLARELMFGVSVNGEFVKKSETLVVSGINDQITTHEVQVKLAQKYSSEFCEYSCAHLPMLEQCWPDVISDIVFFSQTGKTV